MINVTDYTFHADKDWIYGGYQAVVRCAGAVVWRSEERFTAPREAVHVAQSTGLRLAFAAGAKHNPELVY